MRVTLVHNPTAGNGDHHEGEELQALIRRAGHKVTYCSSREKNWKAALQDPGDLIAVAGGDGTVGKVGRRLAGRGTPIALLPTGTSNNIATTLGLTDTPLTELIAGWRSARLVGFDVGAVCSPMPSTRFIEGLGVGFVPAMLRLLKGDEDDADPIAAARRQFHGRLKHYPARHLHVTLDGQDLSGSYISLEAMNIRYIGPKLHLAPQADPGDGLLDLVLLRDGEQDELSSYVMHAHDKTWVAPELTVRKGSSLQIAAERLEMHLDDKLWPEDDAKASGTQVVIEVTVERHALAFLSGLDKRR